MERAAVLFVEPGIVETVQEIQPSPAPNEVLVASRCTAVSAGTEMLVYRGQLPPNLTLDDQFTGMARPPTYPMKYGYCAAGEVIARGEELSEDWIGKRVFAFHPHASHFLAKTPELIVLPEQVSFEDAAMIANAETAVGLMHDGRPIAGERVLILGAGVVGLLTASMAAHMSPEALTVCDVIERRLARATHMGAHTVLHPDALAGMPYQDFDLIYELSGNPAALDLAIQHVGFHGRIVVGSWYGAKAHPVAFGDRFHRAKVTIYSSQVSRIDPGLAGRWTKSRRLRFALEQVARIRPSRLISHAYTVEKAADAYALLDRSPAEALQVILTYPPLNDHV